MHGSKQGVSKNIHAKDFARHLSVLLKKFCYRVESQLKLSLSLACVRFAACCSRHSDIARHTEREE